MATKRVLKELQAYQNDPSPAIASLEPANDNDLTHLTAVLRGPEGTAYEGGRFTLTLTIPPSYPRAPPGVHFVTRVCHANVALATGEICLDLLGSAWTPTYGLVSTLEAVAQLLGAGGEPDSPLNVDVARLWREGDVVAAEALIRLYTRLYAMAR